MIEHFFFADRNGRLTVPAVVRHHLGIGPMEEVSFVLNSDGTVTLRRSSHTRMALEEVLGAIPALPGESIDLDDEIEEAVSEAIENKLNRWRTTA